MVSAFRRLALVFCFALAPPATAAPVLWTVDFANTLADQTVTGSFVYDADTNTFSSINLTSSNSFSGSPAIGNTTYTAVASSASGQLVAPSATGASFLASSATDFTGVQFLNFFTPVALSNSGGTISGTNPFLLGFSQGVCTSADCLPATQLIFSNDDQRLNTLTGVPLDTTVIPLPASLPLFAAGLAGLAVLRRRRCA